MGAFCFPRGERLLKSGDFKKLSEDGKRFDGNYFLVLYSPNGLGKSRLGVTVSKKVGRAVTRNRVKRLVREHFRHDKVALSDSYDVNVIAKSGSSSLSSREISEALNAILRDMLRKCEDEAISVGTH